MFSGKERQLFAVFISQIIKEKSSWERKKIRVDLENFALNSSY